MAADPSGADGVVDPKENRVYVALRDRGQFEQAASAAGRIGCAVCDGYRSGAYEPFLGFSRCFAYVMDAGTCRSDERFLESWYTETADNTPLYFIGDWRPRFFHRSIVDANGMSVSQFAELLGETRKYVTRARSSWRPIVLYPNPRYLDDDFDYVDREPTYGLIDDESRSDAP